MNKEQFERFKELFGLINEYYTKDKKEVNADYPAWLDYYFKNKKLVGEEMALGDYLFMMSQIENFGDVIPYYVEHNEVYSDYFNDIITDLETIRDGLERDNFEIKAEDIPVAEVDSNFASRMLVKMTESESKWGADSDAYKKMKSDLQAVDDYLKQFVDGKQQPDSKVYMEMLDGLEDSVDEYLSHKVLHGVKENASGKVNAASAVKEYIAERRALYYKEQLKNDAIVEVEKEKSDLKRFEEADCRKYGELESTKNIITKLYDEGEQVSYDLKSIMENSVVDYIELYSEFSSFDIGERKERIAEIMLADIVRQELAVSGGKVTPLIDAISTKTEGFVKACMESEACEKLCSKDVYYKYITNDYKKNAFDLVKGKMLSELGESLSISENMSLIKKEKDILDKQKVANDEAFIIELDEMDKLPEASRKANMDKNAYAKAYANLAKFVAGTKVRGFNLKTNITQEEREAGIDISKKYKHFNELLAKDIDPKGLHTKAKETLVNSKSDVVLADTEFYKTLTKKYSTDLRDLKEAFAQNAGKGMAKSKQIFAELVAKSTALEKIKLVGKKLNTTANMSRLEKLDSYKEHESEILKSESLKKAYQYAGGRASLKDLYNTYLAYEKRAQAEAAKSINPEAKKVEQIQKAIPQPHK